MSIDLNSCDETCLACIKSYKQKHNLKQGQKFQVRCNGIPKDYLPLSVLQTIPPEERATAAAMVNPVAWAAHTLDWHCLDPDGEIWKRKNPAEYWEWIETHPGKDIKGHSRYHRPYQKNMLECNSKRKVFRLGRQCLTGDTKIFLANGTYKYIKDISEGDEVLSIDDQNKVIPSKVTGQWNSGKKKVFSIRTKFGHQIKCTSDHRFLIVNANIDKYYNCTVDKLPQEWLSIDTGLSKGSKIAIPQSMPHPNTDRVGALAPLLGYFLSDGSCSHKQSAKFTNITMEYLLDFEYLANELGTKVKWYKKGKGYDLILSNGRGQANPVRDILAELGLTNITGPDKFIPDCIMNAPTEDIVLFLRSFWAGDGYVSTFTRTGRSSQRTEIGTLQESLQLITQLQELLWRFGVHGYIKKENNCYRLVASNKSSIQNFLHSIGPIQGKEEACNKALNNIIYITDKYNNTSGDILWDYVAKVQEVGIEETWDIEIENTHNFVANGIITHNSGKTEALVISMLFNLFTKPGVPDSEGFQIIVITPYQAQIDLIFTRMLELIRSSPLTQNSLKRNVKAPIYTSELYNGSIIRGFTAGTKSGGNAEAVRGQHGHMLVFDESDYLSVNDMDAALSVITNHPNATVWMSSTPSGKREKFFDACHSKRWKEFHFKSSANPLWNVDMEADYREQLTEIGYIQEIEAEFGEQEQGVFQNVYVQAAKSNYKYGDIAANREWTYTIGVDWNDVKHGTTINVLGFDPRRKQFFVVDRAVVSRAEWNQMAACERIAELNRIWLPMAIYVDRGFGSTQVEILQKYGHDSTMDKSKGPTHPDSRLRHIVKAYDFGSAQEVRDLFTKNIVKKHAKGFLVESTVRRFESGDIKFSEYDQALEDQLHGYVIDHVTPTGNPVYKANNKAAGDHALDALMLSVVAFVLEATPLGKPSWSTDIAFSGQFGERKEPPIHQGDLVMARSNEIDTRKATRDKTRPACDRTRPMEQQSLLGSDNSLPAHNTNQSQTKPWSWDGFNRDAPKPRVRSLSEAEQDARSRTGLSPRRRTSRPRRRNI